MNGAELLKQLSSDAIDGITLRTATVPGCYMKDAHLSPFVLLWTPKLAHQSPRFQSGASA